MKTANDVLEYLRAEADRLRQLGTYEGDADYLETIIADIEAKMETHQ